MDSQIVSIKEKPQRKELGFYLSPAWTTNFRCRSECKPTVIRLVLYGNNSTLSESTRGCVRDENDKIVPILNPCLM